MLERFAVSAGSFAQCTCTGALHGSYKRWLALACAQKTVQYSPRTQLSRTLDRNGSSSERATAVKVVARAAIGSAHDWSSSCKAAEYKAGSSAPSVATARVKLSFSFNL
jgi:hypothetical protein